MSNKIHCNECSWRGIKDELLSAINPFDADDEISGCPKCKGINCFTLCCDEPDCWQNVSSGIPTPGGYRQTCHIHAPRP